MSRAVEGLCRKAYWDVRWGIWGVRDALFVRAVARRLGRDRVLFVHPSGEAGARAYIAAIDPDAVWPMSYADIDSEPHSHIEGRMR